MPACRCLALEIQRSGQQHDTVELHLGGGCGVGHGESGVGGGERRAPIDPDALGQVGGGLHLIGLVHLRIPTEGEGAVGERRGLDLGRRTGQRVHGDVVQTEIAGVIAETKSQHCVGDGGGDLILQIGPEDVADIQLIEEVGAIP